MPEVSPPAPPEPDGSSAWVRAEAVAALHLLALRRQFDAIRATFGAEPPHRAREALWVALEVVAAHLRGEAIALRDLVAHAEGLLSAPTLSRAVGELERDGLLTSEPAPGNASLKLLRPTARALKILLVRSEAAFAEFAAIVHAAEQHSDVTAAPAAKPVLRD